MQVVHGALLVLLSSAALRAQEPVPLPASVRDVIDLWSVARPRTWQVFQESSFDRTGGNDDGFSGRYGPASERDGERVVFDRDGPGVVTRIWSANPSQDCTWSFYFDGESAPRVRCAFADLFKGSVPGFPKPFVDDAHGGFVSYVPIPFARHLKVIATGPLFFWQITAATNVGASEIRSFDPAQLATDVLSKHIKDATGAHAAELYARGEPAPAAEASVPLPCMMTFATADGRPIPTFAPVEFPVQLAVDQAVALTVEGPAAVTSLRLHVEGEGSRHLRTTLVRAFVDDEIEPSIEAPLGDLFALVDAKESVHALPFVATPPDYELRFVQPFAKRLRIHVIHTDPSHSVIVDASVDGVAGSIAEFGDRRFFARWQRTTTRKGSPLVLLDAHGAGHVTGITYIAKSAGGIEYLEGDEAIEIDGRPGDAYHGTGTEDFFDSGWYWRNGTFAAPLFGLTHKNESTGEIAAYRMFTSTAVAFEKSLRFTLEHGGGNDAPHVDLCTVTYGYAAVGTNLGVPRVDAKQLVSMRTMIKLPPGAIAFEDCDVVIASCSPISFPTPIAAIDAGFGGPDFISVVEAIPLPMTFDVPLADQYRASLLFSADAAGARIAIDGLGDAPIEIDTRSTSGRFEPLREEPLGTVSLAAGAHEFSARTVGDGRALLLGLMLRPSRDFVQAFDVAGPFMLGIAGDFALPTGGADGSGGEWTPIATDAKGYLDLRSAPHDFGEHSIAFARFTLTSPTERVVTLRLGSDDSPTVFVNGAEIFHKDIHRGAAPDQDFVPLHLKVGANTIVIKVRNDDGGFGLFARISDPEPDLTIGTH